MNLLSRGNRRPDRPQQPLRFTLHPVRLGVIPHDLPARANSKPVRLLSRLRDSGLLHPAGSAGGLRATPTFDSFAMNFANPAANSTIHIEIGVGVLTLVIAVALEVRFARGPSWSAQGPLGAPGGIRRRH